MSQKLLFFRFSLWEIVRDVISGVDRSLMFSLLLLLVNSLSAFSNSFVVLEARCLNFAVVSLFASYIFILRYSNVVESREQGKGYW